MYIPTSTYKITIEPSKVLEDLVNFNVLVSISSNSGIDNEDLSNIIKALGYNYKTIGFLDSNLNNLKAELVYYDYDVMGASFWVHLPVVSSTSTTYFFMTYDSTAPFGEYTSTSAKGNLSGFWPEYDAVYHGANSKANPNNKLDILLDSSDNNYHASGSTIMVGYDDNLGAIQNFNYSSANITVPTSNTFTIEGYINIQEPKPSGSFFSLNTSTAIYFTGVSNKVFLNHNYYPKIECTTTFSLNTWVYIVAVCEGNNNYHIYINGEDCSTSTNLTGHAQLLQFGHNLGYVETKSAYKMLEVRYSRSPKSQNWIKAVYANLTDAFVYITPYSELELKNSYHLSKFRHKKVLRIPNKSISNTDKYINLFFTIGVESGPHSLYMGDVLNKIHFKSDLYKTSLNIAMSLGSQFSLPLGYEIMTNTIKEVLTPSNSIGDELPSRIGKAFDGNLYDSSYDGAWFCYRSGYKSSGNIGYTFNTPLKLIMYRILPSNRDERSYDPTTWKFEAFDGSEWITLHIKADQVFSKGLWKEYTVNCNLDYKDYRLNILSNNGDPDFLSIQEIEFYSEDNIDKIRCWSVIPPLVDLQNKEYLNYYYSGLEDNIMIKDLSLEIGDSIFSITTNAAYLFNTFLNINTPDLIDHSGNNNHAYIDKHLNNDYKIITDSRVGIKFPNNTVLNFGAGASLNFSNKLSIVMVTGPLSNNSIKLIKGTALELRTLKVISSGNLNLVDRSSSVYSENLPPTGKTEYLQLNGPGDITLKTNVTLNKSTLEFSFKVNTTVDVVNKTIYIFGNTSLRYTYTRSMLLYLSFNTQALDLSGNNVVVECTGPFINDREGISNNALGYSSTVNCYTSEVFYNDTFSISVWFKYNNDDINYILFNNTTNLGNIFIDNNELCYSIKDTSDIVIEFHSNAYLQKNNWTHLVFTRDTINNELKWYINNILVRTQAFNNSIKKTNNTLNICSQLGIGGLTGTDEFILINRAFYSSEIEYLFLKESYSSVYLEDVSLTFIDNAGNILDIGTTSSNNWLDFAVVSDNSSQYVKIFLGGVLRVFEDLTMIPKYETASNVDIYEDLEFKGSSNVYISDFRISVVCRYGNTYVPSSNYFIKDVYTYILIPFTRNNINYKLSLVAKTAGLDTHFITSDAILRNDYNEIAIMYEEGSKSLSLGVNGIFNDSGLNTFTFYNNTTDPLKIVANNDLILYNMFVYKNTLDYKETLDLFSIISDQFLELDQFYIQGTITEFNEPVKRLVRAYRDDDHQLAGESLSDINGNYNITTNYSGSHTIVVFDNHNEGTCYNDLVRTGIIPYSI